MMRVFDGFFVLGGRALGNYKKEQNQNDRDHNAPNRAELGRKKRTESAHKAYYDVNKSA